MIQRIEIQDIWKLVNAFSTIFNKFTYFTFCILGSVEHNAIDTLGNATNVNGGTFLY